MKPAAKRGLLAAFIFIGTFLLTSLMANAQEGTLKGSLTVKSTNQKLAYAFIVILKKDSVVRNTMTDASGNFTIKLPAGTYSVQAEYAGYNKARIKAIVVGGNVTNVSIQLTGQVMPVGDSTTTVKTDAKNNSGGGKQLQTVTMYEEVEKEVPLPPSDLYLQTKTSYQWSAPTTVKGSGNGSTGGNSPTVNGTTSSYQVSSNSISNNLNSVSLYNKVPVQNKQVNSLGYSSSGSYTQTEGGYDLSIAGKLTAGEINDFSKWKMWQDIEATKLKSNQEIWKLYPSGGRYTVQVTSESGNPVVDVPVMLKDNAGNIVWKARTDNTGKAELWSHMNDGKVDESMSYEVIVSYNGKEYKKKNARSFYKGINTIEVPATCNVSNVVDVAFVTDATSSMQDEINYLKTDMEDIISKVKTRFPELEIRTAGMFYKCPGNSYVTRRSDFTTDVSVTGNFIKENNAGEGGDEAVETALDEAVNLLSWSTDARARIIFLVLDEPPGQKPEFIAKMQAMVLKAAEKGIRIVPVVCSGEGYDSAKNLEYLTRCFALATNGTYVFLTDHSGIGNSHTAPETDKYKVETLNDILVRLLYQYTKVPSCKEDLQTTPRDTAFTTTHDTLTIQTKLTKDTSLKTDPTVTKTTMGLKYYPNPTTGPLYVEPEGDVKEVYLADINGKLVKRWELTEKTNKLEIDLSEFSSGIYYIQIPNKDKWVTGKVVLLR
jgi:hypothetical protein